MDKLDLEAISFRLARYNDWVDEAEKNLNVDPDKLTREDGVFISDARQAIPALIAEVRRLRAAPATDGDIDIQALEEFVKRAGIFGDEKIRDHIRTHAIRAIARLHSHPLPKGEAPESKADQEKKFAKMDAAKAEAYRRETGRCLDCESKPCACLKKKAQGAARIQEAGTGAPGVREALLRLLCHAETVRRPDAALEQDIAFARSVLMPSPDKQEGKEGV